MEKGRKLELVQALLGRPILSFPSRDEYVFVCIREGCGSRAKRKPKLAVNVAADIFHCWVCGWSGRNLSPVIPPSNRSEYNAERTVGNAPARQEAVCRAVPSEALPLTLAGSAAEAPYAYYAHRRGLSDRTVGLYRLMYADRGEYAGRLIVPSFDARGSVNLFVARSVWDRKPAYMMPDASKDVVVNEHLVDWSQPVILVEGVFDAMAVGTQAVPLLGKFVQPALMLRLLRETPLVHVCLDPDASREAWSVAEQLLGLGIACTVVRAPGKDPADAGRDAMADAIMRATIISDPVRMVLSRSLA